MRAEYTPDRKNFQTKIEELEREFPHSAASGNGDTAASIAMSASLFEYGHRP
jgi:hypothetical protein